MVWTPAQHRAYAAYADNERRRHARVAGSGELPVHSRMVIEGDSIAAALEPQVDFILRTNGQFFLPAGYMRAQGGSTTVNTVSRISEVTSRSPKLVKLLIGTNDLASLSDTPAVIFARMRECIDAYKAAGARVMQHLITPRNDATWTALTTERKADMAALNALIAAQTDVLVADATVGFDPDTDTYDGVHPNWSGSRKVAAAEMAALEPALSDNALAHMYAAASNLGSSLNPAMTGTAGTAGTGVTGQVATSWSSAMGGGMLATARKVTLASGPLAGLAAQEFEVSGTNSGAGNVCQLSQNVTTLGQIGDEFDLWAYFELDAGHQGVRGPAIVGDTCFSPTPSQLLSGGEALSGLLRAPINAPLAAPDGSSAVLMRVYFEAGTVAAKFRWTARYLRKVPIDQ